MASAKKIKEHLRIALQEIGEIKPTFIKKFNAWKFSHKKYPDVECFDDSAEAVIKKYPLYLREFIKHRLGGNIWESIEKRLKGAVGNVRVLEGRKEPKKHPLEEFLFPLI